MIPDNEFTEHCTGDMPSMDSAHHYMLNPEKSDFPDAAARQKEWWERNDTALLKAQSGIRRLEADLRDAISLLVRVDFPAMRQEDEDVWENDRIEFLKRMEVK